MGPWTLAAGTRTTAADHGKARAGLLVTIRAYLLHQTPLHSESRRSALGARFGSLPSALSGKGTHGAILESLRAINQDRGAEAGERG